jgi:predicted transposase YbfD/YdcC
MKKLKKFTHEEIEEYSYLIQESIDEHFGSIEDSRRVGSTHYRLIDIIFITICAILCSANDLKGIVIYANAKKEWLMKVLNLYELPSYSTFWWTFVLLNPSKIQKAFVNWTRSITGSLNDDNIAIDGKALRGTSKPGKANSFVHMVSAWSAKYNFTLAQQKVDGKSNEITAIPKLLDMLDLNGAHVTIDAMGCQTEIAKKIIENGGDYTLALKENQQNLYDECENFFNQVNEENLLDAECQFVEMNNNIENEKHGRIEKRKIYTTGSIDFLPKKEEWKNLQSIVCVHSTRQINEKVSEERRYYISSLPSNPNRQARAIRSHWGIENTVHWILDVGFQEDKLKAKAGNIAENLAVIRHVCLNLLKKDKFTRAGIANKRLKAALDQEYLLHLLSGICPFNGDD